MAVNPFVIIIIVHQVCFGKVCVRSLRKVTTVKATYSAKRFTCTPHVKVYMKQWAQIAGSRASETCNETYSTEADFGNAIGNSGRYIS